MTLFCPDPPPPKGEISHFFFSIETFPYIKQPTSVNFYAHDSDVGMMAWEQVQAWLRFLTTLPTTNFH